MNEEKGGKEEGRGLSCLLVRGEKRKRLAYVNAL